MPKLVNNYKRDGKQDDKEARDIPEAEKPEKRAWKRDGLGQHF
jgi:hypothetical protein